MKVLFIGDIVGRRARNFARDKIVELRTKSSQEILYILSTGVTTVTVGIIGTSMALIADLFLMLLMFFGKMVFGEMVTGMDRHLSLMDQ